MKTTNFDIQRKENEDGKVVIDIRVPMPQDFEAIMVNGEEIANINGPMAIESLVLKIDPDWPPKITINGWMRD